MLHQKFDWVIYFCQITFLTLFGAPLGVNAQF